MANGRRKRIVLSIEKKLEILDRLSKGESQAFLSFEYGIGKSTVADLKKNMYDNLTEEDEEPHDDHDQSLTGIPSSGQAAEMLDQCVSWYEQQEECTATSVMLLKEIRDLAARKRYRSLKQTTLDNFLH